MPGTKRSGHRPSGGGPRPQVVKVGPKGVITIPEENRQAMAIEPGKYLTAVQVGRSLVLSPEINDFLAIAEEFQIKMAEYGVSEEDLMSGQAAASQQLYQELFGDPTATKSKRRA